MGICLTLQHWQEGATGFGPGDFDPPLVTRVTVVGGRGCGGLLGGEAVVEQRLMRCHRLSAGLGLLSLLLFPPDVVQQDLAVAPPSSSPGPPCPPYALS